MGQPALAGLGQLLQKVGGQRNPVSKLFIGGLDQTTTHEELHKEFDRFGACECEIMMDRYTGKSRGFGFVNYFNENDCSAASDVTHVVAGRRVEVSECWGMGSDPR